MYDCLYPWTVGGAERWLTALALFASDSGYDVTFATRLQWDPETPPEIPGVRVVPVSPADTLYREDGTRTLREPVRFGHGVYRYLRENRDAFDIVHTHAFPFFGALAAGRALRGTGVPLVVDWVEVWTREYWLKYAGYAAGLVGIALQTRTARLPQHAFISSELHRRRLIALGINGPVDQLTGLYDGEIEPTPRRAIDPPTVVFAGRHIPEKRVTAVPEAIAIARRDITNLRGVILGDGPDHVAVRSEIKRLGLDGVISTPGFVDSAAVDEAIGSASCLLLPSIREGYGLVVAEAAARGTPSIVVDAPDNAAAELVEPRVNGAIAPSAEPSDLARAIVDCVREGEDLRQRTSAWANARGESLTVRGAMKQVIDRYESIMSPDAPTTT